MALGPSRIVIIGASLAGASAALALREQGYEGQVVLIGKEQHRPYERPPLSKAILLGDAEEPDWVAEADDYAAKDITLLSGTEATAIDRGRKVVRADSAEYPYDKLLIATGSSPRHLDIPGADLAGILTLRNLDDSYAIREHLKPDTRLVIVGAGWIGCEVAAAARKHGAAVTMLDPLSQPLLRVVGEEVGKSFADMHREHEVDLRLGVGVEGFDGSGTVTSVQLPGGVSVPADVVLMAVGAAPNLELADAAGLPLADGGIAVDATLQTADPDIYAAGDVAAEEHPHYTQRVRVEHWDNAKEQGRHVAANLLGAAEPYVKRPFFFSDQYDLGCEYRGLADAAKDRLVVRGSLSERDFTAFWLRDGAVMAAMNVNQWDDGDALQELVDSRRKVADKELTG
jgi:3-phenylpropionate/trans-cinnamate dioxygenase ferredoxin reductase component